ncbi:polysaccharide deacetylase family protein [Magnetospirillum sulfuroxidans]|uniref:Chitooligosaccharide deacetylase n=1 Tax=Magnetospirillum sulfuroxidans TaxID=611300 RepID=A0ABS5IDZ2_9PROT|nr:polysaccharide deacetylase family protein [Magnetospirillum sulfuroxidans]MBR9972641.1 polysaccharide deacetylase family protein [Magnetospirillum sulfuroxidans]
MRGLGRFIAIVALTLMGTQALAADSAVVFMYHRFDDPRFPTANTRLDQLQDHIAELKAGNYTVWPIPRIIAALKSGQPLPERTVGLSIDDAWITVYRTAWPHLKAANLPFTLFVVTDETDSGGAEYMSWDQIREMTQSGLVTIGSQGAGHPHMPALSAAAVAEDLTRAAARFQAELGSVPKLFAWPFGEMSREAETTVRAAGYDAAFGQHSGPAWLHSDPYFLPRFALNETYGEIERFRLAARTLALPVIDVTPADPKLVNNPPLFGFTLAQDVPGVELLACYAAHEGKLAIEQLGPRVEVRMMKPFPPGRGRINCTIPTLDGRWRWFGWQFYLSPDGSNAN